MPLPSPSATLGSSKRRSRRTPSTVSNIPAAVSLTTEPALVACTSIVPGVPSGNRTIRHDTPPTRGGLRPPTARRTTDARRAVTVTSRGNDGRNSCSL